MPVLHWCLCFAILKKDGDHDWVDMKPDPLLNGADIEGNYGVVLRDDILVVDVDVKKFEPGDDPFIRLKLDWV